MSDLFDLSGKKAIVTGGAQGLAKGMAEGLMKEGVETVLFDMNPKVVSVADEFTAQGFRCHGIVVDLGNREAREKAFDEAVKVLGGRLDILVAAAGIQRRHPSEEFPLSDWDLVLNVNLTAVFALNQLAGRVMLKQGYGKIINMASMLIFFGGWTVPAYAASKGGVVQFTKAMCNELAGKGININAIAPGYMATEMNTALMDPANPRYEEITNRIPAHRWGTEEDMKGATVFLASHASDYVDGAVINVDGGYMVK